MNASKYVVALLLILTVAAAKLPAQGQGRGGPPPVVTDKATPEVMNQDPQIEDRTQDRVGFPAHKIVGNLYYIGTVTCSSFLITTPQGNIVINSNYEETLPLMKKAIESLGFKMEDTKILLASHAHPDHQTADAMFKQMTGATTEFMAEDVPALQNMKPGGKEHPIDKILHDGDKVELGGMVLTAHLTPGHTLGTTTWTFPVRDGGRTYNVVIAGAGLPDDAQIVYNRANPQAAAQWAQTIATLEKLPADVFLGAHSWFFNLTGKYKKLQANPKGPNPYIDPAGYKKWVAEMKTMREELIKKQTAAGPPPPRGGGAPANPPVQAQPVLPPGQLN
jgi:metallo-beta-lactamase class B